jgi:hypothetical protein
LRAARTTRPLAAPVGPIQAPAGRSTRALGTPARPTRTGHARRPKVVCERGGGEGVARWGLDQHGRLVVVPAHAHRAVPLDAPAPAAAGAGGTRGRRAHTGRQGQGRAARTARLETAVVGSAGLTTSDPSGPPAHGRSHHRRDVQPHRIQAVVVRTGHGHAYGPAGTTVCLPTATVAQPLQPCAAADDRRLLANGCRTERQPPWRLPHPPQPTARAVCVHVLCTGRLGAWATASRWPCAPEDSGGAPVGWPRWRRQLQEQTRALGLVVAQHAYGIVPLAEYARLVGVTINDRPPGIGTRPHMLAQ